MNKPGISISKENVKKVNKLNISRANIEKVDQLGTNKLDVVE